MLEKLHTHANATNAPKTPRPRGMPKRERQVDYGTSALPEVWLAHGRPPIRLECCIKYLELARVVLELQLLGGGGRDADKDNAAQAAVGIVGIHKIQHRRSSNPRLDPLCRGQVAQRWSVVVRWGRLAGVDRDGKKQDNKPMGTIVLFSITGWTCGKRMYVACRGVTRHVPWARHNSSMTAIDGCDIGSLSSSLSGAMAQTKT